MAKMGNIAASNYRGLKVTVTQVPEREHCLVTVSTKEILKPWDDWSLLFPAIRVPSRELNGVDEVLELVQVALAHLRLGLQGASEVVDTE